MATIPDKTLDQLVNDVTEIKTLLKGYNGYPGLCERHEELGRDYYAFKRRVLLLFGFMVGAGILTGGSVGLVKLLGG